MSDVLPSPFLTPESQREELLKRQNNISARLFILGAVSRLVKGQTMRGTSIPMQGFDQIRHTYVPGLRDVEDRGKTEQELSLVVIGNKKVGYFPVGRIGDADILYPYPAQYDNRKDADLLHDSARELLAAKERCMPNLSSNLLYIESDAGSAAPWKPTY